MTPHGPLTAKRAAAYAELGVDRLVVLAAPTDNGPADAIDTALAAIAGL